MSLRARQAATALLRKHGIEAAPVDVRALAEREGVDVVFETMEDKVSGVLVRSGDDATIGVNRGHHPRRQRFTLAHELGHYVLHEGESPALGEGDQMVGGVAGTHTSVFADSNLTIYPRDENASKGASKLEIEANAFAAELLMPRSWLQSHLASGAYDLYDEASMRKLAAIFGVSEQALTIQLVKHKLLEM